MAQRIRANGEGSVYRVGDHWAAAVTITGADGRPRRVKREVPSQREARSKLRELQADREHGVPLTARGQTIADLMSAWLDAVRDEVRPATWRSYEVQARRHIVPVIGAIRARDLSAAQVREVLRQASAKGLSPTSVRYVYKCLHMAFEQAQRERMVTLNPVDAVRAPQPTQGEVTPFTAEQIQALLVALESDRIGPLVSVAVATGARISELLGLRWESADLERRTLRIDCQLTRAREGWALVAPKTEAGRRVVGLPAFAVAALRAQRVRQLEERLAGGDLWRNDLDLVFVGELGHPLHRRNVLRAFQNVLAREGLPLLGIKELRHSAASLLHAGGGTAKDVQALLGHSSVRVTLDVYTHHFEQRKHETAERLAGALGLAVEL